MSLSSRIVVTLALAATMAFSTGCPSKSCPAGCPTGQTCDSTGACIASSGSCAQDSDCTGSGHKCETTLGICVACLADTDCAGGRCDTSTFTCAPVGCTRPDDCKSTPEKPLCSAQGECVACLSSSDCPAVGGVRQTCDVGVHQCIKNACKVDGDCKLDPAGGNICDVATGGCVACLADADCLKSPLTAHCSSGAHVCVGCTADADCDATLGQTCALDTHSCKVTRCVTDASCDGGAKCEVSSGQCVACQAPSDCSFGGKCSAMQQCVQPATCSADSDCVLGSFCQGGACVACRTGADCRAAQTCSAGVCQEPAACQDSSACSPGRTCQGGVCASVTCTPDPGEPNDTANLATPIPANSAIKVTATICPNDIDNYAVTFPEGSGANFSVKTDPSAPALSLDLYAGPGSPPLHVAGMSPAPGLLRAVIPSAPAGSRELLVRVAGGGGMAVPYEIDADVEVGGLCQNDSREPDDSLTQAHLVVDGAYPGVLCPHDQDWLALDVPPNNRISVTFSSDAPGQGVAVEIRTNVNNQPVVDKYGTTNGFGNATVTSDTVASATGQRFWVQLYSLIQTKATYTATVSFIPQAPGNDHCSSPTILSSQASVIGHLQGSTNDITASCGGTGGDAFWLLNLTQPSKVEVDLAAGFPAVLSIASQCDGTGEVGCTQSGNMSEALSFESLAAGTYFVRVASAQPGMEGDYTISAQVSPAAPSLVSSCSSALPLTFTNSVASASGSVALSADTITSGCGGKGGEAVYALNLAADRKVHATLTGFRGASLSLVPAASCGAAPAVGRCSAADSTGTLTLDQSLVTAGSYMLVVDGGTPVAGHFALQITLLDPVYPPPNDNCASPTDISSGTVTGDTRGANYDFPLPAPSCGMGGHSGDVVYRIVVPSGGKDQQVTLQLNAAFDAALTVTGDTCGVGAVLACDNGDHARVVLADLPPGNYFAWVDGYDTGSGTFSLTTSMVDATPPPANQSCITAIVEDVTQGAVNVTGSTLRAGDNEHPSCQPAGEKPLSLAGPDVLYSVTIPAGATLGATLDPIDFDGALYLIDSCSAATCDVGSDSSLLSGGSESVQLKNTGAAPRTVFVVVDSWETSARGSFSLHLALL